MNDALQNTAGAENERRIRFVQQADAGDVVLMTFQDPAPCCAVLLPSQPAGGDAEDGLVVVLRPAAAAAQEQTQPEEQLAASLKSAAPPLIVKSRGTEMSWSAGRAVLHCEKAQADGMVLALVDFAYFERELRGLEAELAAAWPELEQDRPLSFAVRAADLRRSELVGRRMEQTLQRRMRLARLEPHLAAPDPRLPAAARKLGKKLRDEARIEPRVKAMSGQIEVFEHVYEMASQRMGEFQAAHQGHIMEWIIIVLLGAEALIMLAQTFWKQRG